MFHYRLPEHIRHGPVPGARSFAFLGAVESFPRAILSSVFPILMYRTLSDAETVSKVYLAVGVLSFILTLFVPSLNRVVPRRWLYTAGVILFLTGAATGAASLLTNSEPALFVPIALAATMFGTVAITVCFNAYIMDYIARPALGRAETLRLVYSAAGWCGGPFIGVWLMKQGEALPFLVSATAAAILLIVFWALRLGNGKAISRARRPAANPLAYLPRFVQQPRLIAGWTFTVARSVAWWVYYVYMPILVIDSGYDEIVSGLALSAANAMLFTTPLMLRWMHRNSVRRAIVTGFLGNAVFFASATMLVDVPWTALLALFLGSIFMVLLDVCASLPFLMSVKPSERTEMSAVFTTYRDASGVIAPAIAWLTLAVAPFAAIFASTGLCLAACGLLGMRLHPRLGSRRLPVGAV